MENILNHYKTTRKLTTLVENRTIYSSEYSELNIFETNQSVEKVHLKFDIPVIACMLTGKKVMHLKGMQAFDFFPRESVILPSNEQMVIDFPEATRTDPTQCLALGIDPLKLKEIVYKFNKNVEIENENNTWSMESNSIDAKSIHLTNQIEVNFLIDRLLQTFINNNSSKDVIIDLMLQELVVRLLQTNAKNIIISGCDSVLTNSRIGTVVKYIQDNLTQKDISAESLAKLACMSTSHFHKQFKNTLGTSPIDFVNSERIKFSKNLILRDKKLSINRVAFLSGFNSVSYFNRQFKKNELVTPSQFRKIN